MSRGRAVHGSGERGSERGSVGGSVGGAHRAVLSRLRRRTTLIGVALAASGLLILLSATWVLVGPEGWGPATPMPLLIDGSALALVGLGVWATRFLRNAHLDPVDVSRSIDGAARLPDGSVGGALELQRSAPRGTSAALAEQAQRQVSARLDGDPGRLAGAVGRRIDGMMRRAVHVLLVAIVLAVGLTVFSPARARTALRGLATPIALWTGPTMEPLVVSPGNIELPRGESLEIEVSAPGRTEVTLRWQATGEIGRSQTVATSFGVGRFTIPSIVSETTYWAEVRDGGDSDLYTARPVDPLFISRLVVEVIYPPYLDRPPEEFRDPVPPLVLPVGSTLRIEGSATRELAVATLNPAVGGSGSLAELEIDARGFSGEWRPTSSGQFHWSFEDLGGTRAELTPDPLDLTLVGDSLPTVGILTPEPIAVLPISLRQPLVIEASDDHGLRALELVAYRASGTGERGEPVRQRIDLGGSPGVVARPLLDVSAWNLLPGDTVRYWAHVTDISPGAQTARTVEYVLRMPAAAELRREAQSELEAATGRLEELMDEAAAAQEETRNLERQEASREREAGQNPAQNSSASENPLSFDEREEMQQVLDRQGDLMSDVDSLGQSLEELSEALDEAGLADPELQSDLSELQSLLQEVSSPEMREQLQELTQSLEGMNQQEASDALRQMTEEQDAFRERIEDALENFRRAAVEQDFRATTAEAEELSQQEEMLAEAMREGDDPELRAQQQEELSERGEELQDRMDTLQDRLTEMGENDARSQVQQAAEQMQEAQSAMSEAAQQAQSGQAQQASEQASQAAEAMSEVAQELAEAQQEMADRMEEAMRRALTQAANDALQLSERQAELREEIRAGGNEAGGELQADQSAVQQGVRNLAQNLSVATQLNQAVDGRELLSRAGEAMAALDETLTSMEGANNGRSPAALRASEEAIDALNQLALSAMAQAQSGSEPGGASASEQLMEQLEELAEQQNQLNNQTGSIVPMQLGEQAMSNQLQEMAGAQEAVASDIGELADQQTGQSQALGDLESLAQEAQEIAQRLEGGRLDQETRERQDRLFHRLLDAGRSLEKEEFSEERESEAAGAIEDRTVEPLSPEALGAFRFELPPGTELQRLAPGQRQLILKYFERLNRTSSSTVGAVGSSSGSGGGR